jgi:hypothetical protein
MADDVVLLVPGRPIMRKADFAAAAQAQSGPDAPQFDGSSEIQEIKILGDWAFIYMDKASCRSYPTRWRYGGDPCRPHPVHP